MVRAGAPVFGASNGIDVSNDNTNGINGKGPLTPVPEPSQRAG